MYEYCLVASGLLWLAAAGVADWRLKLFLEAGGTIAGIAAFVKIMKERQHDE